jgi:hypothetical protein
MEAAPGLFELMRRAGCVEVLFGLETSCERVQGLMHKYERPIPPVALEKLFRAVNAAGMGLHISFMGGFPGETPEELRRTVEFVKGLLKEMDNGTYVFNQFELLPGSKMSADPAAFGIRADVPAGDMPLSFGYTPVDGIAGETRETNSLVPSLRDELGASLGWGTSGSGPAAAVMRYLYFSSGHGLIFKSLRKTRCATRG